jgi:hypothetical protein
MQYIYDDGGRLAAGHLPNKDCVTRSIAIATEQSYQTVYDSFDRLSLNERRGKYKLGISNPSTGIYKRTILKYMRLLGWEWINQASCPIAEFNQVCSKVSCPLTRMHMNELPNGRLVVVVSKHFMAVINGILHDTRDNSENGERCVYGYFKRLGRLLPPA